MRWWNLCGGRDSFRPLLRGRGHRSAMSLPPSWDTTSWCDVKRARQRRSRTGARHIPAPTACHRWSSTLFMHTERQKGTIYFRFKRRSSQGNEAQTEIWSLLTSAATVLKRSWLYPADCYPAGWNIYPASNLGASQSSTRLLMSGVNIQLTWPCGSRQISGCFQFCQSSSVCSASTSKS